MVPTDRGALPPACLLPSPAPARARLSRVTRHAHLPSGAALTTAGNHIDHAVTAYRSGAQASGENPPDQEG